MPPTQKHSKSTVDYSVGMASAHCGICRFFHGPSTGTGTCEKVAGPIHANYWCRLFQHKQDGND